MPNTGKTKRDCHGPVGERNHIQNKKSCSFVFAGESLLVVPPTSSKLDGTGLEDGLTADRWTGAGQFSIGTSRITPRKLKPVR